MFITFEGIDGVGKSTQIKRLSESLGLQGYEVCVTRDPGGTPLAERIRNLILSDSETSVDKKTELLLYAAARAQLLADIILPALDKGKIVVCSRFSDSTIAYQGFGRFINLGLIHSVCGIVDREIVPDLTFLLDMSVDSCSERIKGRGEGLDRIEQEGDGFYSRVRGGYWWVARNNTERVHVINAEGSGDLVFGQIKNIVDDKLEGWDFDKYKQDLDSEVWDEVFAAEFADIQNDKVLGENEADSVK